MCRIHSCAAAAAALFCCALSAFATAPRAAAQDAPALGVFAQRLDAQGGKLGPESALAAEASIGSTPAVTALANGDYVAVWDAVVAEESDSDVLARLFAADGTPLGTEFAVNSYTTGGQQRAAIAASDEGFLIVWDSPSQDGDGRGIFAQLFDGAGQPLGSEFVVNSETAGGQRRAAVAAYDGGYVVVWESADQDGSDHGIFGQRLDVTGALVGGEMQVNSYTPGEQIRPDVTADPAGGFVVAWESEEQDNYGRGVFGQRFTADGAPRGEEFRINTDPEGGQRRPALASLPAGGFVVTWDSNQQDGSRRGVFAQIFAADGAFLGAEFQVNTHTTNDQLQPRVAAADDGFLVAWQSFGQDGNSYGIYAQRFDGSGARAGAEFVIPTERRGEERGLDVATIDDGFVTVWERRAFCPGDCSGDGRVEVGELIQAVGVALDEIGVNNCRDADADGDSNVSIAELTRAVRSALLGC